MYVLKHLAELQELPEALRNRIFQKLFWEAEIIQMSPEEKKTYDQSLKEFRDMHLMKDMIKEKNRLIKKQNADLKQKDVALENVRRNSARILIEASIPVEKISESTGLSITEIEKIRKTVQ
jgi:hypothetical protein